MLIDSNTNAYIRENLILNLILRNIIKNGFEKEYYKIFSSAQHRVDFKCGEIHIHKTYPEVISEDFIILDIINDLIKIYSC